MNKILALSSLIILSFLCAQSQTPLGSLTGDSWKQGWSSVESGLSPDADANVSERIEAYMKHYFSSADSNAATRLEGHRFVQRLLNDPQQSSEYLATLEILKKSLEAHEKNLSPDDAALYKALRLIYDADDSNEAHSLLKPLADKKNPEALLYMCLQNKSGEFVEKDENKRIEILNDAVKAKNATAINISIFSISDSPYGRKVFSMLENNAKENAHLSNLLAYICLPPKGWNTTPHKLRMSYDEDLKKQVFPKDSSMDSPLKADIEKAIELSQNTVLIAQNEEEKKEAYYLLLKVLDSNMANVDKNGERLAALIKQIEKNGCFPEMAFRMAEPFNESAPEYTDTGAYSKKWLDIAEKAGSARVFAIKAAEVLDKGIVERKAIIAREVFDLEKLSEGEQKQAAEWLGTLIENDPAMSARIPWGLWPQNKEGNIRATKSATEILAMLLLRGADKNPQKAEEILQKYGPNEENPWTKIISSLYIYCLYSDASAFPKNEKKAAQYFEKAKTLLIDTYNLNDEKYAEAILYLNLSDIYVASGVLAQNFPLALQYLRKAGEINPDFGNPQNIISKLLFENADFVAAYDIIKQFSSSELAVFPRSLLARVYYENGDYQKAFDYVLEAKDEDWGIFLLDVAYDITELCEKGGKGVTADPAKAAKLREVLEPEDESEEE